MRGGAKNNVKYKKKEATTNPERERIRRGRAASRRRAPTSIERPTDQTDLRTC